MTEEQKQSSHTTAYLAFGVLVVGFLLVAWFLLGGIFNTAKNAAEIAERTTEKAEVVIDKADVAVGKVIEGATKTLGILDDSEKLDGIIEKTESGIDGAKKEVKREFGLFIDAARSRIKAESHTNELGSDPNGN